MPGFQTFLMEKKTIAENTRGTKRKIKKGGMFLEDHSSL